MQDPRQQTNGRWQIDFNTSERKFFGRRRSESFATRQLALKWKQQAEFQLRSRMVPVTPPPVSLRPSIPPPAPALEVVKPVAYDDLTTVADFALNVWVDARLENVYYGNMVQPENRERNLRFVRLRLQGTPLGAKPMIHVTIDDVVAWRRSMEKRGPVGQRVEGQLSAGPLKQAMITLGSVFALWQTRGRQRLDTDSLPHGVDYGDREGREQKYWRNPVNQAPQPVYKKKEFDRLTMDEAVSFWTAAPDDIRTVMRWEWFSATRYGEARALRSEDFRWNQPRGGNIVKELGRLAAMPVDEFNALEPEVHICRKLDSNDLTRTDAPMKNPGNGPRWLSLKGHQSVVQMLSTHLSRFPMALPPYAGWLFINPRGWGAAIWKGYWDTEEDFTAWLRAQKRKKLTHDEVGRLLHFTLKEAGITDQRVRGDRDSKRHVVTKYLNGYQLYHPRTPYGAKFYQDELTAAAIKAGLHHTVGGPMPPYQLTHALRHSRVVYLLEHGWSPNAVAEWVGDNVQTIMREYSGVTRKTMSDMAMALGEEFALMG